jgi:hypothetical protein
MDTFIRTFEATVNKTFQSATILEASSYKPNRIQTNSRLIKFDVQTYL